MATLLDLIQEWASLNEAKTMAGGVLPESDEIRWREMRDFYELLMAQEGFCAVPAARHTAHEIRQTVASRERLRISAEVDTIAVKSSNAQAVRIGNLSCGGALLLSDVGWDLGSAILVHLSTFSRSGDLPPTNAQIAWNADSGVKNGAYRYRMGVQFLELGPKEKTILDEWVVESLESKLRSLSKDVLDREFIAREGLAI